MKIQNAAPAIRRLVWVVDDSPVEAAMATSALERDYEVGVFNDGSVLIEKLSETPPPDLLVLDWMMPGVTGIEACRFLRARQETIDLPILLLTAQQETAQIVEGLAAGANDYLGKPYAAAELQARVAALLRSRALRERAEHAERILRRVLAQLPDAVITVDARGEVLFANGRAEQLLGQTALQQAGQRLAQLIRALEPANVAALDGQVTLPDIEIEGHVFAPRVSIPPSDDQGNTTVALRDVTESRRADARRVDFYSMVAHDMRSPLSVLAMRVQLLRKGARGELSSGVSSELDRIGDRVRELIALINDFLDIAQMESAGYRLEREAVDLREIVADTITEYGPLADARSLRMLYEPPREALPVLVDRRRLSQVLGNLLANAIKFTSPGGEVATRVEGIGEDIRVTVVDTGSGIPDTAMPGLFQKYGRVPGESRKVEGTGLGLVIVREIVEAHGGTVGVRSQHGVGTAFWFTLPGATAAAARAAER